MTKNSGGKSTGNVGNIHQVGNTHQANANQSAHQNDHNPNLGDHGKVTGVQPHISGVAYAANSVTSGVAYAANSVHVNNIELAQNTPSHPAGDPPAGDPPIAGIANNLINALYTAANPAPITSANILTFFGPTGAPNPHGNFILAGLALPNTPIGTPFNFADAFEEQLGGTHPLPFNYGTPGPINAGFPTTFVPETTPVLPPLLAAPITPIFVLTPPAALITIPPPVTPTVDLDIVKQDNAGGSSGGIIGTHTVSSSIGTVLPGQAFTYTIDLTNAGPTTLTNLNLADTFPLGFTPGTYTPSSGVYNSATNTWTGLNFTPGDVITLQIGGSLQSNAATLLAEHPNGEIENIAVVTTPAGITNLNPVNVAIDIDNLNTVVKTDSGGGSSATGAIGTFVAGATEHYVITVSNPSPNSVSGTVVDLFSSNPLHSQFLNDTWTVSGTAGAFASNAAGTVTSGSGDVNDSIFIPAGGSITFTVTGQESLQITGEQENQVTYTPVNGIPAVATVFENIATLVKSDSGGGTSPTALHPNGVIGTFVEGSSETYHVTLTNTSINTISGSLTDSDFLHIFNAGTISWSVATPIPTGDSVAGIPSGSGLSGTGAIDDAVTLAPGSSLMFNISGVVSSSVGNQVSNTATFTPTGGAPIPVIDIDNLNTVVKTDSGGGSSASGAIGTFVAGATEQYFITVNNPSPNSVTGTVVDPFSSNPLHSQFLNDTWTVSGTPGAFASNAAGTVTSGSGDVNDSIFIPAGGSITFTVTGQESLQITGEQENQVTYTPVNGSPAVATVFENIATLVKSDSGGGTSPTALNPNGVIGTFVQGASETYHVTLTNTSVNTISGALSDSDFTHIFNAGTISWSVATPLPTGDSVGTLTGTGAISGDAITLAPGSSVMFNITGVVSFSDVGDVSNTATFTPTGGTPIPVTDVDNIVTAVKSDSGIPANIVAYSVVQEPNNTNFSASDDAIYTINLGTGLAIGAVAGNASNSSTTEPPGLPLTDVGVGNPNGFDGNTNNHIHAIAVDPVNNLIYAVNASGLIQINPSDPAAANSYLSTDASITQNLGLNSAITFSPNVGGTTTLYGVAENNNSGLYTISLQTGIASPLGNLDSHGNPLFTVGHQLSGLATDTAGDLFGISQDGKTLYELYNTTAAIDSHSSLIENQFSIIYPNGVNPGQITGMSIDSSGKVWEIDQNGDIFTFNLNPSATSLNATLTSVANESYNGQNHTGNVEQFQSLVLLPGQSSSSGSGMGTSPTAANPNGVTGTFIAGAQESYFVTLTNTSTHTVTGSVFDNDYLNIFQSGSVHWVATVPTGDSVAMTSGTGAIGTSIANGDAISLAGLSSITFTVTGTVPSNASGEVTNTAYFTPTNGVTIPITDHDNIGNNVGVVTVKSDSYGGNSATGATGTSIPGTNETYTITFNNFGPSNVAGATVSDPFPVNFTNPVWQVSGETGGASSAIALNTSESGNISDLVSIPVGGSITFSATGLVAADATGILTNTASLALPSGETQSNPSTLSATVNDTLVTLVKSDSGGGNSATGAEGTLAPSETFTYTITVDNTGSLPTTSNIYDPFSAQVTNVSWTAHDADGTINISTPQSGIINHDIESLPGGDVLTYTVTATVVANATGQITNTATFTPPIGPAYSVTDIDNLNTVVKSDSGGGNSATGTVGTLVAGAVETYTIVVNNTTANAETGTISDPFTSGTLASQFLNDTWSVSGTNGASASNASGVVTSGSGAISENLSLPAGSSLTFTVTGTEALTVSGTQSNTVTFTPTGSQPIIAVDNDNIVTLVKSDTGVTPTLMAYSIVQEPNNSNYSPSDDAVYTISLNTGIAVGVVAGNASNSSTTEPPGLPLTDVGVGNPNGFDGNTNNHIHAIAVDPVNDMIYAVNDTGLIQINPSDPAAANTYLSTDASLGKDLGLNSAITFSPDVGGSTTLYGVSESGNSALYSISLAANGAATPLGGVDSHGNPLFTLGHQLNGLATDAAGDLFGISSDGKTLYELYNSTSSIVANNSLIEKQFSIVYPNGVNPGQITGMTISPNGTVWEMTQNGDIFSFALNANASTLNATLASVTSESYNNQTLTGNVEQFESLVLVPGSSGGSTLSGTSPTPAFPNGVVGTFIAGSLETYNVTVTNTSPNTVTGTLFDNDYLSIFQSGSVHWTATVPGGDSVAGIPSGTGLSGTGAIDDSLTMLGNTSINFAITGMVPSNASGIVSNTAYFTPTGGTTIPVTDTDIINTNIHNTLVKSDSGGGNSATGTVGTLVAGAVETYTIVVNNTSGAAETGTISDPFTSGALAAQFLNDSWTVSGVNGAFASNSSGVVTSGTGDINNTLSLPAGSSITYTVTGTEALNVMGSQTNTVTFTPNGAQPVVAVDTDNLVTLVKSDSGIPASLIAYTIVQEPNNSNYSPSDDALYTINLSTGLAIGAVAGNASNSSTTQPPGLPLTDVGVGNPNGFDGNTNNHIHAIAVDPVNSLVYAVNAYGLIQINPSDPAASNSYISTDASIINDLGLNSRITFSPDVGGSATLYGVAESNNSALYTISLAANGTATPLGGVDSHGNALFTVGHQLNGLATDAAGDLFGISSDGKTLYELYNSTSSIVANNSLIENQFSIVYPNGVNPGQIAGMSIDTSTNTVWEIDQNGNIYSFALNPSASSLNATLSSVANESYNGQTHTGNIEQFNSLVFLPGQTGGSSGSGMGTSPTAAEPNGVVGTFIAGAQESYYVTINNTSSNTVTGNISDSDYLNIFQSGTVKWTATVPGGDSVAVVSGTGAISNDAISLAGLSAVTFTITGTIPSTASGEVTNHAYFVPTGGSTITVTDNDIIQNNIPPSGNLSITKVDNVGGSSITGAVGTFAPGGSLIYTVTIANSGPSNMVGGILTDILPAFIASDTWQVASGSAGTSESITSGNGNINDTVSLPTGGSITFTIDANINAGVSGSMTNVATLTPPSGFSDTNPSADPTTGAVSASDSDSTAPVASNCFNPSSFTNVLNLGDTSNNQSATVPAGNWLVLGANGNTLSVNGSSNNGNNAVFVDNQQGANINLGNGDNQIVNANGHGSGTITVGDGNNYILSTQGNNDITINANSSSSNTLILDDGNNTISGSGLGLYTIITVDGNTTIPSNILSNPANTIIDPSSPNGEAFSLNGAAYHLVNLGGGGNYINAGDNTNEFIMGKDTASTITAGNGNDYVVLGNGPDNVTLGNGMVTVIVGTGNDNITAGVGSSSGCGTIIAGDGPHMITVGDGNYTILSGNGPNDTITAGNGNDIIQVGTGSNTINVGNGNDYIIAATSGTDHITVAGNGSYFINIGGGNWSITDTATNTTTTGSGAYSTHIGDPVSLSLTDVANHATPFVHGFETFTVQVSNAGPDPATNIQIYDPVPEGFKFVSDTVGAGDSYNSSTGIWTIASLPNGGTATLTLTGHIISSSPVTNVATLTAVDQPNTGMVNQVSATVTPIDHHHANGLSASDSSHAMTLHPHDVLNLAENNGSNQHNHVFEELNQHHANHGGGFDLLHHMDITHIVGHH